MNKNKISKNFSVTGKLTMFIMLGSVNFKCSIELGKLFSVLIVGKYNVKYFISSEIVIFSFPIFS
jgi:hypothetical protein